MPSKGREEMGAIGRPGGEAGDSDTRRRGQDVGGDPSTCGASDFGKTAERAKAILMLTIAGWAWSVNAQRPADDREDLIDAFVPKDGSAEAVGVAVEVMDFVAERRQRLFPDLRKIIVDYEVTWRRSAHVRCIVGSDSESRLTTPGTG